jgi:hypothetical protein
MEQPMSDTDTGRRCPRCDCPDGHTQCAHCKACPHAGPQPKPVEQTHLTYEQLLPVVTAIQRRETAALVGNGILLPPVPDCPTCGQTPAELFVRNDHPAHFLKDEVGFGFRPCGHTFTADGEDLHRAYEHARRETL